MATEDFFAVEQLAIAGNVDAQCALGGFYDHGLEGVTKDYQEAVKWYRKAADQGQKEAQYFLGICYQLGKSVNKNNEEAAKWYRKAASQGHANAKEALDWLISEGLISTAPSSTSSSDDLVDQGLAAYNAKDYAKAVELWKKAADMGHTGAMNNLANCYLKGLGVPTDYTKEIELRKKAAAKGHKVSQENLTKRGIKW